jgi:hypothetical protein
MKGDHDLLGASLEKIFRLFHSNGHTCFITEPKQKTILQINNPTAKKKLEPIKSAFFNSQVTTGTTSAFEKEHYSRRVKHGC